jgi:hypothetical protein
MDVGVLAQESLDGLGFVSREIVCDHVDFPARFDAGHHLAQKGHELGTRVAAGGLSQDLSAGGVERRIEGKSAVTEVLETVPLGAPGRERQNRIEPVESLNGSFLVHTENHSVSGRPEIEPNDFGGLLFKLRVVAGL